MLSNCKKYPENTLWFKNKNKLFIISPSAKLTGYTVNGIDSLQALNTYFAWNSNAKDITQTHFDEFSDVHYGNSQTVYFQFSFNYLGRVEYGVNYSKDRKYVSFYYRNSSDTSKPFRKNIFIDDGQWQIMKLDPKGIRKIKKTVNGNTYELQFDKQ